MEIQRCIECGQTTDEIPLMELQYQKTIFHICPQHLPILIHKPHLLAGKLAGAEGLSPSQHHD